MTTRYVGAGGNDSNTGLSWAQRKLTLNGVEDTPVQAGDIVYVGPGVYRELLTCDVSGSSGSPITYIGDYDGTHTDGTGGIVRISGSDNDLATARNNCINVNGKDYRTFNNFNFAFTASYSITGTGNSFSVDKCYFSIVNAGGIAGGSNKSGFSITNCVFWIKGGQGGLYGIFFDYGTAGDYSGVINNCIFIGGGYHIRGLKVGGVTVKNCLSIGASEKSFSFGTNTTSYPCYVYNSIIDSAGGLIAGSLGELVEDYNLVYARTNVGVGDHSVAYHPQLDTRWFFEMVGGGDMATPFDLASYSTLLNVAGTSPTTADMRGTTVQGAQREWGALEYDSTLDIEAGSGTTGGAVKIMPLGKVGL